MDLTGQLLPQLCDCDPFKTECLDGATVTVTPVESELLDESEEVVGNGYAGRRRPELVSLAARRGVKGSTRMDKAKLVQSLKRLDAKR